jgi:hypothetical protein
MTKAALDDGRYASLIVDLVRRSDVAGEVQRYFEGAGFAGYLFDLEGSNPPFELTNDDIFALNFLDVPVRPYAYRALEDMRPRIHELLERIGPTSVLWEISGPGEDPYDAANELWHLFVDIQDVGPTVSSKLLARKRPHLVPIHDHWVKQFYGDTNDYWMKLARALSNEEVRAAIDRLRPHGARGEALSLLRVLDVAIWMIKGRPPP